MALRGTLTHRKTRRLATALNIDPCHALGLIESLWHVTAEQTPQGDIGRLSNQDIADEMFFSGDADALVAALIKSGYVDSCETNRLVIHDWPTWADNSVHAFLAKRIMYFCDGTMPKIPHEAFNSDSRNRIIAKYEQSQKVPDESPTSPGQVPDASQTSPDKSQKVRANPEPEPEPEPIPKPKPKPDKSPPAPEPDFPPELDFPNVREAVSDWITHRKQLRKPATPNAVSKLLKSWIERGPAAFVAALEHSISNGWLGVFSPDNSGKPPPNTRGSPPQSLDGLSQRLAEGKL